MDMLIVYIVAGSGIDVEIKSCGKILNSNVLDYVDDAAIMEPRIEEIVVPVGI